MENECINVKRTFKTLIAKTKNDEVCKRLKDLFGMIHRVYDSSFHLDWAGNLLNSFSNFLEDVNDSSAENSLTQIEILEIRCLSSIVSPLKIPAQTFHMIYQKSKIKLRKSKEISKMIPKFLYLYLKKTLFLNKTLARQDFDSRFSIFFKCLDVPYNHFSKSLAVQYLGQGNDLIFKLRFLEKFLKLFFGSLENYKFYVKVARIVESASYLFEPGFRASATYKIVLTSRSENYSGCDNILPLYSQFLMDSLGIQGKQSRRDGIIIFGRHRDADVVFPHDEKNIDLAAFLIFHLQNKLLGIDISKKTYCSVKLQNGRLYELKTGQLLNLAKTELFLIKRIDFSDAIPRNDDTLSNVSHDINSILTIENQEGLCKGINYEFYTQTRDPITKKLIHIIGCGGGGVSPDFFIHPSRGISRRHAQLIFDEQKATWSISECSSTNGTYLLMKNFEQFYRKIPSSPISVIEIGQSHGVFMIEKNAFFISLEHV